MAELSQYKDEELLERFDAIARELSDSGTSSAGGIADTGVCEMGDMFESVEQAILSLRVGDVSGVVLSDSGAHIILRTALDRPPPIEYTAPLPTPPAEQPEPEQSDEPVESDTQYRALHVLVKHSGSENPVSWRDASGKPINRSRGEAMGLIQGYIRQIEHLRMDDQYRMVEELAKDFSDARSADTGCFDLGEMEAPIEKAVVGLSIGGLSKVVESTSGCHVFIRTPLSFSSLLAKHPSATSAAVGPTLKQHIQHGLRPHEAQSSVASVASSVLRAPATGRDRGWPGCKEDTPLHARLRERLIKGKFDSTQLFADVKELCGDGSFASSPAFVQDSEGVFPSELAQMNEGVPINCFEYLLGLNPSGDRYHRLLDALRGQRWVAAMGFISKDPDVTWIVDQDGRRAMYYALYYGAPTRFLHLIGQACPIDRQEAEDEDTRRTGLAAQEAEITRTSVEKFVERTSSRLAREDGIEWQEFYNTCLYARGGDACWWRATLPSGLEAVAHRVGTEHAANNSTSPNEVAKLTADMRELILKQDSFLLRVLCQRGTLSPGEMKHCLDLDITGVDDHANFWQLANVRAALAIDTGEAFVTRVFNLGRRPLQWAVCLRASVECVDELLKDHDKLKLSAREGAEMIDVEGKTLLHMAAECGSTRAVVERLASTFPMSVRMQDVSGRFPWQLRAELIGNVEQQKEGALSMRLLPDLKDTLDYLDQLFSQAKIGYELLSAVGGPKAFFNGGGTNGNHQPNWERAHALVTSCAEAAGSHSILESTDDSSPTLTFTDNEKKLPLHHAIAKGADFKTVKAIYDAFPEAVKHCDSIGRLPLHLVAADTPVEALQLLLKVCAYWPLQFV
jgi:NIMA-interacting peptidyl-prolyl cis-trans isomerase 1